MVTAARVLAMVERRVSSAERSDYLAGVAAIRAVASSVQAHFWVFERDDEPGHFVEFTEAADATRVASTHGGVLPAPVWREVQGG